VAWRCSRPAMGVGRRQDVDAVRPRARYSALSLLKLSAQTFFISVSHLIYAPEHKLSISNITHITLTLLPQPACTIHETVMGLAFGCLRWPHRRKPPLRVLRMLRTRY
jgi:hypothetical protein